MPTNFLSTNERKMVVWFFYQKGSALGHLYGDVVLGVIAIGKEESRGQMDVSVGWGVSSEE